MHLTHTQFLTFIPVALMWSILHNLYEGISETGEALPNTQELLRKKRLAVVLFVVDGLIENDDQRQNERLIFRPRHFRTVRVRQREELLVHDRHRLPVLRQRERVGKDVQTLERILPVHGLDVEALVQERELLLDRGQRSVGVAFASGENVEGRMQMHHLLLDLDQTARE